MGVYETKEINLELVPYYVNNDDYDYQSRNWFQKYSFYDEDDLLVNP